MDSSIGLTIQWACISLITLLSFFMLRWFQSISTKYWTIAWTCLSISLLSLLVGFQVHGELQRICYMFYFLGEYSFGLMFAAGCRNHARGDVLAPKHVLLFAPFAMIAAALPRFSDDFNNLFIVQAALMAGLFVAALYALGPVGRRGQASPGVRVTRAALFLLALDFLQYVPAFSARQGGWGLQVPDSYFKYTSIVDLILEILLGFGTIMVLMEGIRQEVEAMNRDLTATRDRLQQIAHVDPLTGGLTRHAFESVRANPERSNGGCAAVIDLDNLKAINDRYGHSAGDAALLAVAKAVRAVTRADDMLFRWGGDEFLVLMFGISEPLASQRLESLNGLLAQTVLPGAGATVITVSHGLSTFGAKTDLQLAIEKADEAMYRSKQASKGPGTTGDGMTNEN